MIDINGKLLNNILDEDNLKKSLVFSSVFITLFENMKYKIVDNIKELLSKAKIENGELINEETKRYEDEIINRQHDGKQCDKLKASILWCVDNGIYDNNEYNVFLKIREKRNDYAHHLFNNLYNGLDQDDIELFIALLTMNKKFDYWWINDIEAPIGGYVIDENCKDEAISTDNLILDMIIDIALMDNKDEYKELIERLKE